MTLAKRWRPSLRATCLVALSAAAGPVLAAYLPLPSAAEDPPETVLYVGRLSGGTTASDRNHEVAFTFRGTEDGGVNTCAPDAFRVTADTTGFFSAAVSVASCAPSPFDNPNTTYDVSVDGKPLVKNQPLSAVARVQSAEHVPVPDCPPGYDRTKDLQSTVIECTKPLGPQRDVVVRVGNPPTVFWIDRYEATLWSALDGTGIPYGTAEYNDERPDYPSTFPPNGQGLRSNVLFSASVADVKPSSGMTWFQANRGCRASGKALPTGEQWLAAARGTLDNQDGDKPCNMIAGGDAVNTRIRTTGAHTSCVSLAGAVDMVGNLAEWTSEWDAGLDSHPDGSNSWSSDRGAPYWGALFNVEGPSSPLADGGPLAPMTGSSMPIAIVRGGSHTSRKLAGVFAFSAAFSPSDRNVKEIGFRCVTPL